MLTTFHPTVTMLTNFTFTEVLLTLAGCDSVDTCLNQVFMKSILILFASSFLVLMIQQAQSVPTSGSPLFWKSKSVYAIDYLPFDSIDSILFSMKKNASKDFSVLILDPYGGLINDVASEETAFPHRNMLYSVQFMNYWSNGTLLHLFGSPPVTSSSPAIDWINSVFNKIRSHFSAYSYVNYIDRELQHWQHAYYGSNLDKLESVKCQLDPFNYFSYEQSISCRNEE